jgi:hypothetical protein
VVRGLFVETSKLFKIIRQPWDWLDDKYPKKLDMKTSYFFKESIESIYCETSPVKDKKVVNVTQLIKKDILEGNIVIRKPYSMCIFISL